MPANAHDLVLSFCRSDGCTRLFEGNYGLRSTYTKLPAPCIVTCLDWTQRPNLAEGNTWEEVYVALAVRGALDLARVETEAMRTARKAEEERENRPRHYRRRRYFR